MANACPLGGVVSFFGERYYYYNETAPLYLFMAYAKAAQENPSPAAMAILAKLAVAAKAGIKAKQKEK